LPRPRVRLHSDPERRHRHSSSRSRRPSRMRHCLRSLSDLRPAIRRRVSPGGVGNQERNRLRQDSRHDVPIRRRRSTSVPLKRRRITAGDLLGIGPRRDSPSPNLRRDWHGKLDVHCPARQGTAESSQQPPSGLDGPSMGRSRNVSRTAPITTHIKHETQAPAAGARSTSEGRSALVGQGIVAVVKEDNAGLLQRVARVRGGAGRRASDDEASLGSVGDVSLSSDVSDFEQGAQVSPSRSSGRLPGRRSPLVYRSVAGGEDESLRSEGVLRHGLEQGTSGLREARQPTVGPTSSASSKEVQARFEQLKEQLAQKLQSQRHAIQCTKRARDREG
jgi:hypothetical protein